MAQDGLIQVLGANLLGRLVGVSPSSLRRYSSGERATPEDVAARLNFIALIVGELRGAYNEVGIGGWFARPRSALGGTTPASLFHGDWSPDDEAPRRAQALAESLAGSAT